MWLALEQAYAPHSSSREYTLKTQLLKITMQGDETLITYLTRAHGYASALANIGEDIKDKEMVLLVISDLREDCNGLKSTLLAHRPCISFIGLHALLNDHDYTINKTLPTATAS